MKIIIITLIGGTLLFFLRDGGLRIQYGSNQHHAEQAQIFSGKLLNVTGELLMTRSDDALPRWEEVITQTRTLDFWLYDFSYQPLLQLFQRMARGGVKIRAIVENEMYGGALSKNFIKLQKLFTGQTYMDLQSDKKLHDNFMHAKTFITDDAFIIQTANLTYGAFFNNREFFFVSHDSAIRQNLAELFQKDHDGIPITSSDILPNVVFCPIDCRHKIETLISGAKHSIRMYQQYIQDPRIMSILMQRSGLDLKFIVADNSSKSQLVASPLSGFTHFRKKPYVHAKMILVDDTYLILSSVNMSANSMDNNREIGIILIDSNIINQFRSQFERDWKR